MMAAAMAAATLNSCSLGAIGGPSPPPGPTETQTSTDVPTSRAPEPTSSATATARASDSRNLPSPSQSIAPSRSFPGADLVGTLFIGLQGNAVDYCAVGLIDSTGKFWEVFWPDGYRLVPDGSSAALISPQGTVVASDGSLIGVDGNGSGGSFCMIGEPFEATSIKFVDPPVLPERTPVPPPAAPTPSPTPSHPPADLVGHLAGDSTPGCGLLVPDASGTPKPWKVHWPDGYRVSFGPGSGVALISPDGSEIAHFWDLVGVDGTPAGANGMGVVPAAAFGCDWPVFDATEVVFEIPDG